MKSVRFEISPCIILKFPVWLLRHVEKRHWCLLGALAPRPEVDRVSPPPGRRPGLGSLAPNLQQPLNRLLESPRRKQPQVSKPWPLNPQHPTWWFQPKVPPPHSWKFLSPPPPSMCGSGSSAPQQLILIYQISQMRTRGTNRNADYLCCWHQDRLPIWCDVEQDPGYSSPQLDVHKQPTEFRISSYGKSYIRYLLSWEEESSRKYQNHGHWTQNTQPGGPKPKSHLLTQENFLCPRSPSPGMITLVQEEPPASESDSNRRQTDRK
jgi:hypothetical protein